METVHSKRGLIYLFAIILLLLLTLITVPGIC